MLADDFDAERERMEGATKRLNEGEPIPEVDASWIENVWEVVNRIPGEQKQHVAIGLGAIAGGYPDAPQIGPEARVALLSRFMLLDALAERGVLDEYLRDEAKRKKMFAATASISCDKNDLGEALALKELRELPADLAEKKKEELRLAGCDPEHPGIDEKFHQWIRDNS